MTARHCSPPPPFKVLAGLTDVPVVDWKAPMSTEATAEAAAKLADAVSGEHLRRSTAAIRTAYKERADQIEATARAERADYRRTLQLMIDAANLALEAGDASALRLTLVAIRAQAQVGLIVTAGADD